MPHIKSGVLNSIVEVAYRDTAQICKDILRIRVPALEDGQPLFLTPLGAPKLKTTTGKWSGKRTNDLEEFLESGIDSADESGDDLVEEIQNLPLVDPVQAMGEARGERWQNVARAIAQLVMPKELPNLESKNVSKLFPVQRHLFFIVRSAVRFYIGEVLDIYKKETNSTRLTRFLGIPFGPHVSFAACLSTFVGSKSECILQLQLSGVIQECTSSDGAMYEADNSEDSLPTFTKFHHTYHLHTHAPISNILYLLGSGAFDGPNLRALRLTVKAAKHWLVLTRPVVKEKLLKLKELVFSKNVDELTIFSTSSDETVRIWNADTGKQVGERLLGHAAVTSGIAVSSDGTKILSGGDDGKIIMWSAETREIIRIIKPRASGASIWSLSFSPDDKTFASASSDGTCRIWNTGTGGLLLDFDDHQGEVEWVAYSPNGAKIASGADDHTIRIRNTLTGERLTQPLLHEECVRSLVWSPDSRLLISACDNGQICFWSAPTGAQLGPSLQAHFNEINCMAISPNGSLLASASSDHTARLWSTVTRKPFGRVFQHSDEVYTVAFSPNGQFFATGGAENVIFLWDISHEQEGLVAMDMVSVSPLHVALAPPFADVVDQPLSSSDSLAGSPRPSSWTGSFGSAANLFDFYANTLQGDEDQIY
ncbi:WD40-repeat-containing domain protein [Melanogaster broomeanus]|nr:WD40-repeat-containing domain protein [Melanogaster broomeanus]